MNRLVKYITLGCYCSALLLTSCIKDGLDECPDTGRKIQFVYDYNMSFEDIFHKQATKVDLFLFDEYGVFLKRLTEEATTSSTFPKGYTMTLPEEYSDAAQFVAFPGIHVGQTFSSVMVEGQSRINDLSVRHETRTNNTVTSSLKPLWHGRAKASDSEGDTIKIPLTKNTNSFRIVLQTLDNDSTLNINEFSLNIKAANSAYDAYNTPTDNTVWTYQPFFKTNDTNGAGAVAEIHTLRLMTDRNNTLTIRYIPMNEVIVDLDLNRYINALKLQEHVSMPLQEFMDREDEYKILILLKSVVVPGVDPNPDTKSWVATEIVIQPWEERDQDATGR